MFCCHGVQVITVTRHGRQAHTGYEIETRPFAGDETVGPMRGLPAEGIKSSWSIPSEGYRLSWAFMHRLEFFCFLAPFLIASGCLGGCRYHSLVSCIRVVFWSKGWNGGGTLLYNGQRKTHGNQTVFVMRFWTGVTMQKRGSHAYLTTNTRELPAFGTMGTSRDDHQRKDAARETEQGIGPSRQNHTYLAVYA